MKLSIHAMIITLAIQTNPNSFVIGCNPIGITIGAGIGGTGGAVGGAVIGTVEGGAVGAAAGAVGGGIIGSAVGAAVGVEATRKPECSVSIDTDYANQNIVNNGLEDKQPDVASCRSFCRPKSRYFTWADRNFDDALYRTACWCKTTMDNPETRTGALSGTTDCKEKGQPDHGGLTGAVGGGAVGALAGSAAGGAAGAVAGGIGGAAALGVGGAISGGLSGMWIGRSGEVGPSSKLEAAIEDWHQIPTPPTTN